jgi:tight adherence protein C
MCRRLVALALMLAGLSLLAVAGPTLAAEEMSGRAIVPPGGTPAAAGLDDELIVEEIRTDQFPKVSARFSIRPLQGRAPGYLELHDIAIVNDGILEWPLESHTVGRVPTSGVGQYEVTWFSNSGAAAGSTITGRLAISINSRPEIGTGFTFIRPFPRQAEAPVAAPVAQALIPVRHPDPGTINRPLANALAAIFAGTAFLVTIGGMIWHARWRRAQDRLAMWVGRSAEHRVKAIARSSQSRRTLTVPPIVQFFGKWGAKMVPSAQTERLRRSLVLAGRPTSQHYTRFVATKAGLAFGLFMAGFWLMVGLAPFGTTLMLALTMAVIGFMLPSIWLGRTIKARQHAMKKALPDALDLITIGVSAGLSFDGALGEITEKWDNDLSHEFATMLGELRMGMGRRDALLNLADRTQVDEIQIMVSQLIQADELGMSLTDTLLTLADQMRLRRRQHAEELAHKAAVKMLIPLVFLIFPALFIVILGPAAADLIGFVTNGPK